MTNEALQQRTIEDFREQWVQYQDNEGYYCSAALFRDILDPQVRNLALMAGMKTRRFHDLRLHHTHGYSWSVFGTKP
jgi:hypothetical protein